MITRRSCFLMVVFLFLLLSMPEHGACMTRLSADQMDLTRGGAICCRDVSEVNCTAYPNCGSGMVDACIEYPTYSKTCSPDSGDLCSLGCQGGNCK